MAVCTGNCHWGSRATHRPKVRCWPPVAAELLGPVNRRRSEYRAFIPICVERKRSKRLNYLQVRFTCLVGEALPNVGFAFTPYKGRICAACDVATLWTDVEKYALSPLPRNVEQHSGHAFAFLRVTTHETTHEVGMSTGTFNQHFQQRLSVYQKVRRGSLCAGGASRRGCWSMQSAMPK